MKAKESLQKFYERICQSPTENIVDTKPHINVFERRSCKCAAPFSRRDYFKVTLLLGKGTLVYADKSFEITKPVVLFSTPLVPYQWMPDESESQLGWFAIFNSAFLNDHDEFLSKLPMFQVGTDKILLLEDNTKMEIAAIFEKMMAENQQCNENKQNIMRNYLHLIVYQALKTRSNIVQSQHTNSSERITALFLELLERQFPVESSDTYLRMKTAQDFAKSLSIHVNSLNRAVKRVTGQTTTTLIAARIVNEANSLIRHSDWNIAEIAFALGFEEPAYFTNFMKKKTGKSPNQWRTEVL